MAKVTAVRKKVEKTVLVERNVGVVLELEPLEVMYIAQMCGRQGGRHPVLKELNNKLYRDLIEFLNMEIYFDYNLLDDFGNINENVLVPDKNIILK